MEKTEDISINIFINNDLKMGKGKIIGQSCHAIHYIIKNILNNKNKNLKLRYDTWQNSGHIINIYNKTEEELLQLSQILESTTVIDAGKTQIAPNSMTVVGFYPNTLSNILNNLINNNLIDNTNDNFDNELDDDYTVKQYAMYIFINTDLKLKINELVREAGIVTNYIIKSLEQMKDIHDCEQYKNYKKWDKHGCAKIILKATTEQLNELKLINSSLYITQQNTNIITALGFYPNIKNKMEIYTKDFKLL